MKFFPNADQTSDPTDTLTDSLLLKLIFLLLSILLCSLLGTLLIQLFGYLRGMDLATVLADMNPESSLAARNFVRSTHLLSQISTFTIPALLVSWFFYRRRMWSVLSLTPLPSLNLIGLGVLITLFSFPLTQFTYWLNQAIPLPSWMSSLENKANDAIQALLVMDSPGVLLFNLTVIALLPAIGEELLFRGFLQQQLAKRFGWIHLAVWITAFIFSAFHLQFAGFFPRLLLGGLLGYLLLWSRSLWVPIAAHFVFNGIQVVGHYILGKEIIAAQTDKVIEPNWFSALLSLILVLGGLYLMKIWGTLRR